MAIVPSYITILKYWRSTRSARFRYREALRAKTIISESPNLAACERLICQGLELPLHVLVANDSFRRKSKDVVCHGWSAPLPKGAILEREDGLYVSSPEFCFLQMAKILPFVELIELGYEFCGTYDLSGDEIKNVEPLTTLSKIKSFITKIPTAHGIKNATRALNYIAENSASPMETRLTILLCMPYRFGGYGLALPSLNHRIDVREKRRPNSAKYYVCDLFWPNERLAVEYDSNMFHAEPLRVAHDTIKRDVLDDVGVMVVPVTHTQLQSVSEMDALAKKLAKRMHKKIRYVEPNFSLARYKLRKSLKLPSFP